MDNWKPIHKIKKQKQKEKQKQKHSRWKTRLKNIINKFQHKSINKTNDKNMNNCTYLFNDCYKHILGQAMMKYETQFKKPIFDKTYEYDENAIKKFAMRRYHTNLIYSINYYFGKYFSIGKFLNIINSN